MEWDSMLSERATRKVIQSQNKKKTVTCNPLTSRSD